METRPPAPVSHPSLPGSLRARPVLVTTSWCCAVVSSCPSAFSFSALNRGQVSVRIQRPTHHLNLFYRRPGHPRSHSVFIHRKALGVQPGAPALEMLPSSLSSGLLTQNLGAPRGAGRQRERCPRPSVPSQAAMTWALALPSLTHQQGQLWDGPLAVRGRQPEPPAGAVACDSVVAAWPPGNQGARWGSLPLGCLRLRPAGLPPGAHLCFSVTRVFISLVLEDSVLLQWVELLCPLVRVALFLEDVE